MRTKQDILDAIRQTARENSGRPLGTARFAKETGITSYEWGKYWARFGDAQKEAGCLPNKLNRAYSENFLIEKVINLARKLGRFPTYQEMTVARGSDPTFPHARVYARRGSKGQLVATVKKHCEKKAEYDDVLRMCDSLARRPEQRER